MEANDGRQAQGAYIPQELLKEISKVNNRLLIGIPRERCEAEKRLPLTPEAGDMRSPGAGGKWRRIRHQLFR